MIIIFKSFFYYHFALSIIYTYQKNKLKCLNNFRRILAKCFADGNNFFLYTILHSDVKFS